MWHFAGVYFCGLGIFSVSLKLIFATIGHIGFPRWELIFAIFKKFPATSIDNIFVLVKYVQSGCNRNTYFQTVLRYAYHVKPVIHCIRFVSEWKRRVVIEQTQFFCTLFLWSNIKSEYIKFTLEYIFAGEMFALIFFLGGWEGTYFRKNFVPHGISSLSELCLFCWQLVSISEENNNKKKSSRS